MPQVLLNARPPSRRVWKMSSVSSNSGRPAARRRALSSLAPLPRPVPSSRTTALSAGSRANSPAQVRPSRATAIRPVIQQRLSGSTTIRAGLGPKNLIGGGLLDPGAGRLVEDFEQGPSLPAGHERRPPQRRHARGRLRSGHDVEEAAGDSEADPLGLGDGGELLLHVAGDLHGSLQAAAKGLIFGLAVGELLP